MTETVYWINGHCWACGCPSARRNVRRAWCCGCGCEIGSLLQVPDDSPDAARVRKLRAAYDQRARDQQG